MNGGGKGRVPMVTISNPDPEESGEAMPESPLSPRKCVLRFDGFQYTIGIFM